MSKRKNVKGMNASVVERNDNTKQLHGKELDHYRNQMKKMFRTERLPPVLYKGRLIEQRVLSDFSYLTN